MSLRKAAIVLAFVLALAAAEECVPNPKVIAEANFGPSHVASYTLTNR